MAIDTGLTLAEIREQIERLAANLTTPRKRFADLYLANGQNGTKAYLAVFKTKKPSVAAVGAHRLTHRSDIRSYIELCKQFTTDELLNHMAVTKERVLDEEANLAFIDYRAVYDADGEMIPPHLWPESVARAISGFDVDQKWDKENGKWQYKYKIRFNDKGRALNRLETVLGMNKAPELGEDTTNMFKSFLESIDGKTRGKLPSEMEEDTE